VCSGCQWTNQQQQHHWITRAEMQQQALLGLTSTVPAPLRATQRTLQPPRAADAVSRAAAVAVALALQTSVALCPAPALAQQQAQPLCPSQPVGA
jgi:hypothetical protein